MTTQSGNVTPAEPAESRKTNSTTAPAVATTPVPSVEADGDARMDVTDQNWKGDTEEVDVGAKVLPFHIKAQVGSSEAGSSEVLVTLPQGYDYRGVAKILRWLAGVLDKHGEGGSE